MLTTRHLQFILEQTFEKKLKRNLNDFLTSQTFFVDQLSIKGSFETTAVHTQQTPHN